MALPIQFATVQDAICVAVEVARGQGLAVEEPILLRSTNNAVAWLSPANVVVKVSEASNSRLDIELQVAKELNVLGAPVVSLAAELPAIVHRRNGLEMTFWTYHAQREIELPPGIVAHALSNLHGLLESLSPALKLSLPSYMEELNFVRSLLADQAALPSLASADREMLSTTFDRLRDRLDQLAPASAWEVIHGSPHEYNMLVVSGEPAFIDFETTCFGPREWDLAHLNADVEPQFARSMRAEVLSLCRQMTSVKTATLCVADIDRGDMREHAEYHLARITEDVARTMG
jgi:hypothetical protein